MRTRTPVDDLAGTGLYRDGPSVPCPAGPVAAAAHHHARSAGVRPSAGIAPRSARVATIAGMGDDPHAPVAAGLENLKIERDAIVLYDALAGIEKDPAREAAFRRIGETERRHADIWATRLAERGVAVPPPSRPRIRVRFIIAVARRFGTRSVSDMVRALEGKEESLYQAQGLEGDEALAAIAADEAANAEVWRRLDEERASASRSHSARVRARSAVREPGRDGVAIAKAATGTVPIVRSERWHRAGQSGTLRATVFGVSDGLVSNTALVMGVAGADPAPSVILLSGIAGLLAGAFSMAAGEWVSMQSQRELFERQIELERAELEEMPEEEEAELAAAYRSKGFTPDEAARDRGARCSPTPRSPSTPSCARSWAWTRSSSARRGAPPSGRSSPSSSGRASPSSRTSSSRGRPPSPRASDSASSGCSSSALRSASSHREEPAVQRRPPGATRRGAAGVTFLVGKVIGVSVS